MCTIYMGVFILYPRISLFECQKFRHQKMTLELLKFIAGEYTNTVDLFSLEWFYSVSNSLYGTVESFERLLQWL